MASRRRQRGRRFSTTRLLLVILVAVLVLGGVIAAVVLLLRGGSAAGTAALTELPFTAVNSWNYTGSGFLFVREGAVQYYDLSDEKQNFARTISSDEVKLAACPGGLRAVYNRSSVQILDAAYPLELTGEVLQVQCGKSHMAVLRRDTLGAESILVYDYSATQVDEITTDQFIVHFGFAGTGSDTLWVQTLDVNSLQPVTTFTLYNTEQNTATGVLQVQNQLVESALFTDSSIFLCATNHLFRFEQSNNREAYREMVYGWRVLDQVLPSGSGNCVFLLTPRNSDGLHAVKICTVSQGAACEYSESYLQLPADAIQACLMDGKLVVVRPDRISRYDYSGKQEKEFLLDVTAEDAQKLDNSLLLLRSGNQLFTTRIK